MTACLCHCPCGSGAAYADCCERWHDGQAAPTADELMRSRYSAFALGRAEYVLSSWHPSTRPPELALPTGVTWLGLDVRSHRPDGAQASVEFVARSKTGGRATRLHEISRFVQENGRWYYVDGDIVSPKRSA